MENQIPRRFAPRNDNHEAACPACRLNPSGSSEADRDLSALDDDRNAPAAGNADHPVELPRVALHVDVGEGNFPTRVVLTGRGRVGSAVLPEDLGSSGFHPTSAPIISRRADFGLSSKRRMAARFSVVGGLVFLLSFMAFGPRAAGSAGSVSGRIVLAKSGTPRADASNAVVWIEGPRGATGSAAPLRMAQESKRFVPRVLIVPRHGTVEFPNDDPVFHNVFSVSGANRFDLGLYRSGASKSRTFAEPGLVRVYCNIHPQMVGFLMVVDSGFGAITGKDGVFHFEGVPAGSWTIKAWHEEGSETSIPLSVPLSPSSPLTLTIDTTAYRPVPHKNKYGKEYPPQSGSDDERY